MLDVALIVLVTVSTAWWWFWLGYLWGQYRYEPPPCERRHKDEL